jgi:hypothetical protein
LAVREANCGVSSDGVDSPQLAAQIAAQRAARLLKKTKKTSTQASSAQLAVQRDTAAKIDTH